MIRLSSLIAAGKGADMNTFQWKLMIWTTAICVLFALSVAPALANAQGSSPNDQISSPGGAHAKNSSAKAGSTVSDADIAAAKASGKVWVNLDSGIYHKRGRWYGKTKNGKFMTEDEAKKAGYRKAKRE
jgi:hypothetical protein